MAADTTAQADVHLTVRPAPSGFLRRPRFLWTFVPFALVAVVGVAALLASGTALLPLQRIVVVEGHIASKAAFFQDAEVKRILLRNHLRVNVTQSGSRDFAKRDFTGVDFLFPSGQPSADLILDRLTKQGRTSKLHKPFTSPIVLATFRQYAEGLRTAGLAEGLDAGERPLYYRLDMPGFLRAIEAGRKWKDLAAGIDSTNRITAFTPNICLSNSGSTYMGLVAFVHNNSEVPQAEDEAKRLAEKIKPLLGVFGMPPPDLFNSYVTPEGHGKPIVVVYEHQFLAHQVDTHARTGGLDRDRVLLYPSVNVLTEPALISLTPAGEKIGNLMIEDEGLRRRAVALGFRPLNTTADGRFGEYLRARGIPPPTVITEVATTAQLPRQELLERMNDITGNCSPR